MAQNWRDAELPLFAEAKRINDPERALKELAKEASACTRCPLYKNATQTVFGEGPADAALMLVGEQPGDQEDVTGRPFVGPAGKVLDRALESAGIERSAVYITNAVKHFKNEPRGKRRIHKKPDTSEIDACRWWLDNELAIVQPNVVVALGATAARAVMHKVVTINANRGRLIELPDHRRAVITVHPSYLLRLLEDRDKRREFDRLVKDLRFAADAASGAEPVNAGLERVGSHLAGAHAHDPFEVEHEDLAIANTAGPRRLADGLDHLVGKPIVDGNFQLHLRHILHGVFGPAVNLGLPLLPAEAARFGHRQPLHADGAERLAHRVEAMRLDDCNDVFHALALRLRSSTRIWALIKKLSPRGIENVNWLQRFVKVFWVAIAKL